VPVARMPFCCCPGPDDDDNAKAGGAHSSSKSSGTDTKPVTPPGLQTMQRGGADPDGLGGDGTDSDYRAVEYMRSRSSGSRIELTASEFEAWQKKQQQNHRRSQSGSLLLSPSSSKDKEKQMMMATLESIEIDDLSRYQYSASPIDKYEPRQQEQEHDGTSSSTSSSSRQQDFPSGHRRSEPDQGDAQPSTRPQKANKSTPPSAATRGGAAAAAEADELDAIMNALQEEEQKSFSLDSVFPNASDPTPKVGHSKSGGGDDTSPSSGKSAPVYGSSGRKNNARKGGATTYTMEARPTELKDARVSRWSPRSAKKNIVSSDRLIHRQRPPPVATFPDSLSDVPDSVDPDVRDRYLKACRLLKATLIERETALLPTEKIFLHGLLDAPEHDPLSDERVSAIETASYTLLSDPLFQVGSVHSSSFEDTGYRATGGAANGKASWQERAFLKDRDPLTKLSDNALRAHNRGMMPSLVDDDEVLTDAGASAVSVARFDGKDFPFYILGVTPDFKVGVLTPHLMESLRGFFPVSVSEQNFWLKFSLHRDGASLPELLSKVRTSKHTIVGVETTDGHVFGAFVSTPWRVRSSWFGSGECFLWRLKRSRFLDGAESTRRNFDYDNEMEVYPYTGSDDLIQYCTHKTIAIGGGDWSNGNANPYRGESPGIGFMVDGDLMGGETNACATFNNPSLGERMPKTNEFDIRNLEVWTGKFSPKATNCILLRPKN